jgi:hypothetical protein
MDSSLTMPVSLTYLNLIMSLRSRDFLVIGGRASDGQTLYVGRGKHMQLTIPGKIHPSHRCLYLPCDWKEHSKSSYEVLVRNASSGWIPPPTMPQPPTGPSFPGGHSSGELYDN